MRFTLKNLLALSGLTFSQYRKLKEHNLIRSNFHYFGNEVVYCRLIYLLRIKYSLQKLRKFILPLTSFGEDLLVKNYIVILDNKSSVVELKLLDSLEDDDQIDRQGYNLEFINKLLDKHYFYIQEDSRLEIDRDELSRSSGFFINLKAIREELQDQIKNE